MKELSPEQIEQIDGGTCFIQGLINIYEGRGWDETPIQTRGSNPFA